MEEDLLSVIHTRSTDPQQWLSLSEYLDRSSEALEKGNIPSFASNLAPSLDANMHTIAYVWLLHLFGKRYAEKEKDWFLVHAQRVMLEGCPEQIKKAAASKFGEVCLKYATILTSSRSTAMRSILPLREAIRKLQTTENHITFLHSAYLRACIAASNYKAGLKVLREDMMYEIDESCSRSVENLLLFFYYGGCIYIGLKKHIEAVQMFRLTFTIPAEVLSAIAVESYKKYILISLILRGEVAPLPKFASSVYSRSLKSATQTYSNLITAYQTRSIDNVAKIQAESEEHFLKDENFGLVKQVVDALKRQNIKRLTDTFLTLSLAQAAKEVGLSGEKEAERLILGMMARGDIHGRIHQGNAVVTFSEDPKYSAPVVMRDELNRHMERSIALGEKIKQCHEELSLSKEYLKEKISNSDHPSSLKGSGPSDK